MENKGTVTSVAHGLRNRHVNMITFGGMIGAGLFIGSGSAIHNGGIGVVAVYLFVAIIIYFIMRMLGEMATSRPCRGTFVDYTGAALGPWASFLSGWLYWYFWVFTIGAETVAGAALLQANGIGAPIWAIGLGLILALAVTNAFSVRAYGELESLLASVKILSIVAFIGLCLTMLSTGRLIPVQADAKFSTLLPNHLVGLLQAMPIVVFSMVGSEIAAVAAAESDNPARNIARASKSVAIRSALFYIVSVGLIALIVAPSEIIPGVSPFTLALRKSGVPGAEMIMTWVVITAVLSCLNSGLYITSRILFGLSRNGHAPIIFAQLNGRKVPMWGLLVGTLAGAAAAFAQIYMKGQAFALLAGTSGDIILFIYALIALAQIRQRRSIERAAERVEFGVPFFPWSSYAVLAAILCIVVLLGLDHDQRVTVILSLASTALVLIAMLLKKLLSRPRTGLEVASADVSPSQAV